MSSQVFHRNPIFNNPAKAWEIYKNKNFGCFSFPERITVELTNRCNLQCVMCPRSKVKMRLGDMDADLFKNIINEASHFLPTCLVAFFRGESLLHPNLLELLSFAKNKGLKPIQLASNAFFLDSKITDSILDLGIDFISFSVDVNNPETYKKIRKNSYFEKIFSNILYFISRKEKKKMRLPIIQVSAVKTEDSKPLIQDFINFWKNKVDRVRVYPAHSLNGLLGHLQKDTPQNARRPCLKLLTDIVIYWDGEVAICNHDWQRESLIGNIKGESIEKIWKSEIYNNIRDKHLNNELTDFSPCDYCSHWKAHYQENYFLGELYEKDTISLG